jgi:CheY-like chemotaxis protein
MLAGEPAMNLPRVLIVDDDVDLCHRLADELEGFGYDVLVAFDGEEALATLRRERGPFLVLLDLLMPKMNGWRLREAMTLDPVLAGYPVIVMSATDSPEEAAISASAFLRKPVQLQTVVDALDAFAFEAVPQTLAEERTGPNRT